MDRDADGLTKIQILVKKRFSGWSGEAFLICFAFGEADREGVFTMSSYPRIGSHLDVFEALRREGAVMFLRNGEYVRAAQPGLVDLRVVKSPFGDACEIKGLVACADKLNISIVADRHADVRAGSGEALEPASVRRTLHIVRDGEKVFDSVCVTSLSREGFKAFKRAKCIPKEAVFSESGPIEIDLRYLPIIASSWANPGKLIGALKHLQDLIAERDALKSLGAKKIGAASMTSGDTGSSRRRYHEARSVTQPAVEDVDPVMRRVVYGLPYYEGRVPLDLSRLSQAEANERLAEIENRLLPNARFQVGLRRLSIETNPGTLKWISPEGLPESGPGTWVGFHRDLPIMKRVTMSNG